MQPEDMPTVLERYARAANSSDLSLTDHADALTYLMAMAAATAGRNPAAAALMHLAIGEDRAAFNYAIQGARQLTWKISTKSGWQLSMQGIKFVALRAVLFVINPVCGHCDGLKFDRIQGTPTLSAHPCPHCHGAGLRPLPAKHGRRIAEVRFQLKQQIANVDFEMRRQLRRVEGV